MTPVAAAGARQQIRATFGVAGRPSEASRAAGEDRVVSLQTLRHQVASCVRPMATRPVRRVLASVKRRAGGTKTKIAAGCLQGRTTRYAVAMAEGVPRLHRERRSPDDRSLWMNEQQLSLAAAVDDGTVINDGVVPHDLSEGADAQLRAFEAGRARHFARRATSGRGGPTPAGARSAPRRDQEPAKADRHARRASSRHGPSDRSGTWRTRPRGPTGSGALPVAHVAVRTDCVCGAEPPPSWRQHARIRATREGSVHHRAGEVRTSGRNPAPSDPRTVLMVTLNYGILKGPNGTRRLCYSHSPRSFYIVAVAVAQQECSARGWSEVDHVHGHR